MKLRYLLYGAAVAAGATAMTSCSDDLTEDLRSEARIESFGFTVESPAVYAEDGTTVTKPAKTFKVRLSPEDDHLFQVRISPFLDHELYLTNCVPTFCVSMGAKVDPPMTEPQDFSDPDNPVVYTVTSGDGKHTDTYRVSYTLSDLKPYGEGMGDGEQLVYKTYVEMGFPGTYASWAGGDDLSARGGDLLGMPAFCGKDKIVVFSRRYAWGDTGAAGAKYAMAADPAHAFLVYDVRTLEQSGSLNLGSIKSSEVVAVTSDWAGNMVAAVGRKAGGKTDFYYWTSPDAAPEHIGTTDAVVDISINETDAGSYINVAGDITTNAVIATSAPRTDKGQHYKFHAYRGVLEPTYEVIETGRSELDQSQFQMISYYGTSDSDPYIVGDTSPNGSEDNGQVKIAINNFDGSVRAECDYHPTWYNGAFHDDGEQWWSRSGKWLSRNGARRPTVHAMVLNGKEYAYFTTGTDWRMRALMTDTGFSTGYLGYPTFGFGLCTKDKHPTHKDGGMWLNQSLGCMADWYFDDEAQEGYVAVWTDRWGMNMFYITCYE